MERNKLLVEREEQRTLGSWKLLCKMKKAAERQRHFQIDDEFRHRLKLNCIKSKWNWSVKNREHKR